MAVFNVSVNGSLYGVPIVLTLDYWVEGVTTPTNNDYSEAIAQAIVSGTLIDNIPLLALILGASSNDTSYTSLQVLNPYNPFDFAERAFTFTGGINETAETSAQAYLYSSNRTRTDIDRGRKFVAGVVQSAYSGNTKNGAYAVYFNGAANALSATLTLSGVTGTAVPVVLKTYRNPETLAYKSKWPSQAEQEANLSHADYSAAGAYPKPSYLRGRRPRA